jgi:hypothetical protein
MTNIIRLSERVLTMEAMEVPDSHAAMDLPLPPNPTGRLLAEATHQVLAYLDFLTFHGLEIEDLRGEFTFAVRHPRILLVVCESRMVP